MPAVRSYPVRARVLDVTGELWRGLEIATPPDSRPHVGKMGLAERIQGVFGDRPEEYAIRLTLDDGTILWGWECWWEPVFDISSNYGSNNAVTVTNGPL